MDLTIYVKGTVWNQTCHFSIVAAGTHEIAFRVPYNDMFCLSVLCSQCR